MFNVVILTLVVLIVFFAVGYGLFMVAELFDDVINPWIGYHIRKCWDRLNYKVNKDYVMELEYDEFTDVWSWGR